VTTNDISRALGLGLWVALGTSGCGSDTPRTGQCSISAEGNISSAIGPVGIVTFTVSGASTLDSAQINFGLDTNYGLSAPVDVTTKSSDYRTLMLGMKVERTYHYQVIGKSGTTTCTSPDYSLVAGGCPTSLKRPTVTIAPGVDKSQLDGGFMVMEGYNATFPDDYAYILDGEGDLVWCYAPTGYSDLSAVRMSWDGRYTWLVHANAPEIGENAARMGRVSMDGLEFQDHSSEFLGLNHDAAVLPNDEGIVYIAYTIGGCDDIREWKPDGTTRTIINSGAVFGGAPTCHNNAIKYDSSDHSIIASEDNYSAFYKVDLNGNLKWVLNGGTYNDFDKSGGGVTNWVGQHNLHILGTEADGLYHILFFNNGSSAANPIVAYAVAREVTLDTRAMTTKEVWTYESDPAISNTILGDVQRLDNGNTLVTYSLAGKIQEVDANKKVLREFTWSGANSSVGYVTKRKTLYGPSPR
jgi:hypothetical protein